MAVKIYCFNGNGFIAFFETSRILYGVYDSNKFLYHCKTKVNKSSCFVDLFHYKL